MPTDADLAQKSQVAIEQIAGWRESWFIFAAYALVVGILFWIIFKDRNDRPANTAIKEAEDTQSGADGFVTTDRI